MKYIVEMSQRKKSRNNSIFEGTKGMSVGLPNKKLEHNLSVKYVLELELNEFQKKHRAFKFDSEFSDDNASYKIFCYGTCGDKEKNEITRICTIVPREAGEGVGLPSLLVYEDDVYCSRGRVRDESWTEDINRNIEPQVVDQNSLQYAYDEWYSRKTEFEKAVIDLIDESYDLTWRGQAGMAGYYYYIFLKRRDIGWIRMTQNMEKENSNFDP